MELSLTLLNCFGSILKTITTSINCISQTIPCINSWISCSLSGGLNTIIYCATFGADIIQLIPGCIPILDSINFAIGDIINMCGK